MAKFIFLTLLVSLAGAATSTHYHIVPITSTALCTHYPVGTCFTLEEISSQVSENDTGNITISFLPGEHLLTWNMTFNGTNDITLNMELHNLSNGTQPRISCTRNSGFVFVNLHTLTIEALEIYGCESTYGVIAIIDTKHVFINKCQFTNNKVTGLSGYHSFLAGGGAIYLLRCTSTVITKSTFLNNNASCFRCYGGAILFHTVSASIDSCFFERNTAFFPSDPDANIGGGALAVIHSNVSITNSAFHGNRAHEGGSIMEFGMSFLSISGCMLINNRAMINGGAIHAPTNSSLNSFGNVYSGNHANEGGAVRSLNTMFTTFSEDNFTNNSAHFAGASIKHSNVIDNEQAMSISDCIFKDNWSKLESAGVIAISGPQLVNISGEVLFLNNRGSLHTVNSNVHFYGNMTFRNNTGGDIGGAIASTDSSVIIFETTSRTIITGNSANYGGGFFVDQGRVNVYGSMVISDNKARAGGGIHAFQSVIEFRPEHRVNSPVLQHTNIFKNEANINGGGMYLTATNIKVSNSHIYIYGNTAKQYGGGIFLEQSSYIDLGKWKQEQRKKQKWHKSFCTYQDRCIRLEFTANSALRGGAVYVSDSSNAGVLCEYTTKERNRKSKQCFLQTLVLYSARTDYPPFINTINTFFNNNTATDAGSDVYGGLLDRCTVSDSAEIYKLFKHKSFSGLEYLNATIGFDWADGHIQHSSDFYDHISSDPVRVCFCQNDHIDCNSPHPTVFTKKGRTFTLSIVAVDQVGKPVNATLISSLKSGNGEIGGLKVGQEFKQLESWCTALEYNAYSNNSITELQLYADGPCGNQGISKQHVNISFLPCNCPIGFQQYPRLGDCFCDCDRRLKSYISNCSSVNHTIQINTNVWIDYINTTNASGFVTPHCPFDYCVEKPVNISLASPGETDQQCAFNRTGRMCGQCEVERSLVFASSSCQKCSNYYLFLLIPFALAGVALVTFILALNITVATGTIHGLIFYANLLAANRSIFLPFSTPNFLTVYLSWLNLDLGIETCFYDGMDSYGKFLLQLAFPVYVFLIIVAIIVLCDRSQRLAVFIGKRNPEATLYTLLLLSYSKLIRLIITALQFTIINYPDGTQKIVWLYDANIMYFSVSHIPRFLVASIIILLGTVYTTLLLFGQLFDRCSEHKLMKWATHKYYTHFIRAHQAPLSDKHRYWVGLLLLARLMHYLISAFAADPVVILFAGTVAFVLVLYKLLNKQIYNSWSLDLLETSFLVNLVVLALSTLYIRSASGSQQILAFISMSVCFITFLGIVLCNILDKCDIKLSTLPQRALQCYRQCRCYQPTPNEEEEERELFDEDKQLLKNSPGPAHCNNPPIIRHAMHNDQLREPALDDLIPIQPEDYDIPQQPRPRRREMVTYAEIHIGADREENILNTA